MLRPGEQYEDPVFAAKLDLAPQVGCAVWARLVEERRYTGIETEVIVMPTLRHADGVDQYRARPGRSYLASDGEVVCVLTRNLA